MTFEETQVLEVLGGKELCFVLNYMMPSIEEMMMGEEISIEITSCEASIDKVPCECNMCPDGEMAKVTCESIGVMSSCTDMVEGIWGELLGGDDEEVESAQVSRSMPFFQAIPNEDEDMKVSGTSLASTIPTAMSLFVSGIVTILALVA